MKEKTYIQADHIETEQRENGKKREGKNKPYLCWGHK